MPRRPLYITGKVRLSSILEDKSHMYQYGDVIKFSGKLKLPQGQRNPNGFDYKSYLLQKGISTIMFSREIAMIGKNRTNPFMAAAFYLRERLITFYETHLSSNLSSLIVGITLGIKDNIPGETMKAVKNSGVAHALAVSGLHTGVIYGALELVFYRIGISRKLSFVIESIIIIFYSFMAGLSPSVVRAAIMIMVFMLSKIVGRENDSLNSLCFSAVILLLINPLTLFSVSFQLSYAAVIGIILFYAPLKRLLAPLPKYLNESTAAMVSAQLVAGPVLAYHFYSISLVGFIANLLVVPLVSLILISGLISGIIGFAFEPLGALFVKCPGFLLDIVERIVLISSSLPFATIIVPAMPIFSTFLYFISLALIFDLIPFTDKYHLKYKKAYAIVLMLIAILPAIWPFGTFEVTFIDVGQGDSILIQTKDKKFILIDGGGTPAYSNSDFDTGEDIILPILYSKGIKQIDLVVFTHFDDDHAKGLLSILKSMKVKNIIYGLSEDCDVYREMLEIAKQKRIKTIQVSRGDSFIVDNAAFEVLHPVKDAPYSSGNNNSVVLKMSYNSVSFLFTGDLEYEGEQSLISSRSDIKAHVLKIGHHGSLTSTSREFLSKVNPMYGVITVGADNKFGHPSPQVINLLKESGITVFRTDINGAISFKIFRDNVKIYTTIFGGET
ncbi:MAG: DNA internalization-related competence protein ComEC/Rec2 [Thermoanaerobacteraceae bacterium]|nr:DNA internalization-related competence protein ComEC/Rec2 [Thermoanaerobacteraceae bacterium]